MQSALAMVLLCAAGCRDDSVRSYRIPKEVSAARTEAIGTAPAAGGMASAAVPAATGRDLAWTAPAHWRPQSGSSVRKGSYAIGPEDGAAADLGITAFPGDVGGDLANVNRWRSQLQLPPIAAAELARVLQHVDNNGLHMNVVELVNPDSTPAMRMLSAIVPFEGATWFFKLTGPDQLVAQEKTAFMKFLETVKPSEGAAPVDPHAGLDLGAAAASRPPAMPSDAMSQTPVPTASGPALKWVAPPEWESQPGSAMRKGSYVLKNGSDEVATLAITAFPGDVGGELANVNRWRNQLQLPPLSQAELAGTVRRHSREGLDFTVVELTGAGAAAGQRLLGAIVPFEGATWFFKLSGPDAFVAQQRDAFRSFLDTVSSR